ncbi:MAG: hypothetical protein M2R45_05110 [Verrucomicrobia subdivision 3 bacterium]|nr:hypothetical protein [Limisphaerales bacterium]MCS1417757.1 hypothetical protein [Limisphaerales bacterium]
MDRLPQTRSCFACGKNNPHGLNLAFQTDGSQVLATWIPQAQHTGFTDMIHGGIIATVLDEIMAWTCGVIGGRFAYSVDLNIRYSSPLRPGDTVLGFGAIEKNRRSKIFHTRARIVVNNTEIAAAGGKYLAIKELAEASLWADFGEDAAALRDLRAG